MEVVPHIKAIQTLTKEILDLAEDAAEGDCSDGAYSNLKFQAM